MDPRAFVRNCFDVALAAADPRRMLAPHLPTPGSIGGRLVVVGAGKAAASMAQAVEAFYDDAVDLSGLVVTRYGYGLPCRRIEVIEAAHPVPDDAGIAAAARVEAALAGLSAADTVLALVSGGASALLAAPREGVSLAEKRALTSALLKSGASIHEINCVRKHLSRLKGGRLAVLAAPARLLTLALSDVAGDEASVIGSGPTVPDPSTCADALEIAFRYRLDLPPQVRCAWEAGDWETPKDGDPAFAHSRYVLAGSAAGSLEQAAAYAASQGVTPIVLGDAIEGEAREVAKAMAGIALSCRRRGQPSRAPCVILSGGETTVTVRARPGEPSRGGRNSEFLLGLALALRGTPGIHALAADTDGIDGSEDNAGAIYGPEMWSDDALATARAALARNDAWGWFADRDALIVTGPTCTNVNDFRAIYVEGIEP
jgi:hydroxypyruvate reductase